MKIGVIGSVNIDFVYETDNSPLKGETVFGKTYCVLNGGKGANQGVIASALTDDLVFLGAVGNDMFGDIALSHLEKKLRNYIDIVKKEAKTGMAVIELSQNDNRITVVPGANLELSNEDVIGFLNKYTDIGLIVLQLEISLSVVEFIINECSKRGIAVILNPAPVQKISENALNKVSYLIPNETEFEEIYGNSNYENEVFKQGGKLLVTMGERGVMYYDKDEVRIVKANTINPVDTTGAGDSFVAGFSVGISKGLDIKDAIQLGINVASVTCVMLGAQGGYDVIKERFR